MLRDQFKWTLGILGTLSSAISLISAVQALLQVDLSNVHELVVLEYRQFVRSLVDWIPLPFGWQVTQWYLDLFSLNCIIAASYIRSRTSFSGYRENMPSLLSAVLMAPLLMSPLLVVWAILNVMRERKQQREYADSLAKTVEDYNVRNPTPDAADWEAFDQYHENRRRAVETIHWGTETAKAQIQNRQLFFIFIAISVAACCFFFGSNALLKL